MFTTRYPIFFSLKNTFMIIREVAKKCYFFYIMIDYDILMHVNYRDLFQLLEAMHALNS